MPIPLHDQQGSLGGVNVPESKAQHFGDADAGRFAGFTDQELRSSRRTSELWNFETELPN